MVIAITVFFFIGLYSYMKLPAHSAVLPGNDLLFDIVPLDLAHRAGLAGHAPVKT